MVSDAGRWIDAFARAGADVITVHEEACPHLDAVLGSIRSLGKKAGVALNPHTPEGVLDYVLEGLDMVLVMTVNPGFGGQQFLPSQLLKIERLAKLLERRNPGALIQVDGGVSPENAKRLVDAGARVLVAGAAIFGQPDPTAAIAAFRAAVA
jgi:ribulose-phosphate 3-epimerase